MKTGCVSLLTGLSVSVDVRGAFFTLTDIDGVQLTQPVDASEGRTYQPGETCFHFWTRVAPLHIRAECRLSETYAADVRRKLQSGNVSEVS